MERPTYEDTRHGPKPVHAGIANELAVGWRRQHATQTWQAMQCWAAILAIGTDLKRFHLDRMAAVRNAFRDQDPELMAAVERLSRL